MNTATLEFILNNPQADTSALLLGASRYKDIDIPTAARCIQARRTLKIKVPSWLSYPELLFPYPIALEQCSSESTAIYKQRFITDGARVADLTAGLGVDSFFLSQKASHVDCFEHNSVLAEATKANFATLGASNITITEGDSATLPDGSTRYDLIYLDPDRRSSTGSRLYSVRDCEPDITLIKGKLFALTDRILVKVSPMADIAALLRLLPETAQVHVVSVSDECKEVLLLLERGFSGIPEITAAEISIAEGGIITDTVTASIPEEKGAVCHYATDTALAEGHFLLQPWRAIVKAGFLRLPSERFGVTKISSNVHFYLSPEPVPDFPGKQFRITKVLPFCGKVIKTLNKICPAASVTARDLPLTSDQLRSRAALREDDTRHIFAFPTSDGVRHILICNTCS